MDKKRIRERREVRGSGEGRRIGIERYIGSTISVAER